MNAVIWMCTSRISSPLAAWFLFLYIELSAVIHWRLGIDAPYNSSESISALLVIRVTRGALGYVILGLGLGLIMYSSVLWLLLMDLFW